MQKLGKIHSPLDGQALMIGFPASQNVRGFMHVQLLAALDAISTFLKQTCSSLISRLSTHMDDGVSISLFFGSAF